MTPHSPIARVGMRDAAPAGGRSAPQAPGPSTGAAPIPTAPGGESEALGVGIPPLKLAERVSVCPADFSEIDGEDYDAGLDAYLSWQAAIGALREAYLRNPDAPELGKGRW